MNLREIADEIDFLKANAHETVCLQNLYLLSKILSTQFLSPRVKPLFKDYCNAGSVFIYSCARDPNVCQLSMHKDWDNLVFAWIREDATFVFVFPKDALYSMGLVLNHADRRMQETNALFKQSLRFTEESIQEMCEYLVDIIEVIP
jgi:hypothetical protein